MQHGVPVIPSPTATRTPSRTPTSTPSPTGSPSKSPTVTTSPTASVSVTPSNTGTPTESLPAYVTPSVTSSATSSPSATATNSLTSTPTPTATRSSTANWFGQGVNSGFAVVRILNGTVAADTTSLIRTQPIFIDDFSGCTGADGVCERRRSLAVPSSQCTISSQAVQGRLSRSTNGEALVLYCIAAPAGVTLSGTVDTNGTVAMVRFDGQIDVSRRVRVSAVGAGNGLNAANLPTSAASENADDFWTVAEKQSGAQGWYYFRTWLTAPVLLRGNDGYRFVVRANQLFGLWGGTSVRIVPTSFYKTAALPDASFVDVFVGTNLGMADLDVSSDGNTVWAAGTFGLVKVTRPSAAQPFGNPTTFTGVGALFHVALSNDGSTVYAANRVSVWAFDVQLEEWRNGGAPIYTETNGALRGIAAIPSLSPSATPTNTPSITGTSTPSPTGSSSQTGTPTASNTFGITATSTSTPSNTGMCPAIILATEPW